MSGFVLPSRNDLRLQDPNYLMSQNMIQGGSNSSPVGHPLEALARALQGTIGGYEAGKVDREAARREGVARTTLQDAMQQGAGRTAETRTYGDGTQIDWNAQDPNEDLMIQTLMSNPDTSGKADEMLDRKAEGRMKAESALQEMMMKAYEPMTPYQRAKLGSENLVGVDGSIVPKYRQEAIQSAMGGGMPAMPGLPATSLPQGTPPAPGALSVDSFGGGLLPPPSGMAGPAMGSAPPGAPMPVQPVPSGMGTPIATSPKAAVAGQEQMAKDVAKKASPETDVVGGLTNTLAMAQQLKVLNATAYDGRIKGPATQAVAQLFGDESLSPAQQTASDAYGQFDRISKTLGAEAVKPLFGSAQLSDADRKAAEAVASVISTGSRSQRAAAIETLIPILTRKRDLAAAEQQAALEGRAFGPNDVAQIYAQQGLDYATGQKMNASAKASPALPTVGEVRDNWRFKGGDPAQPGSWEQVR